MPDTEPTPRGWGSVQDGQPHYWVRRPDRKGLQIHISLCGLMVRGSAPAARAPAPPCTECTRNLAAKLPIYLHRGDTMQARVENARSTLSIPMVDEPAWPRPEPQAGETFLRKPSAERKAISPALELIALLDPGGSQFIAQMQNTGGFRNDAEELNAAAMKRAAAAKACPRCRGRGALKKDIDAYDAYRAYRVAVEDYKLGQASIDGDAASKRPDEVAPADSPLCSRCQGSGQLLESGHRASTPSKEAPRAERLTAGDVAAMLAGVEQHKVRAALVYMLDDERSRLLLDTDVRDRIVMPSTASWKDGSPEGRDKQIEWMSWFAVTSLRMAGGRQMQARHVAPRLGVSLAAWYKVWQPRHRAHVATLEDWVVDVSAVLAGQREARWTA